MGFRPAAIVDAVGGVEGGEFSDRRRGELEDVETAVSEDSEVLGGANCYLRFVKRAEFY